MQSTIAGVTPLAPIAISLISVTSACGRWPYDLAVGKGESTIDTLAPCGIADRAGSVGFLSVEAEAELGTLAAGGAESAFRGFGNCVAEAKSFTSVLGDVAGALEATGGTKAEFDGSGGCTIGKEFAAAAATASFTESVGVSARALRWDSDTVIGGVVDLELEAFFGNSIASA
ncbi:hypothetical protein QCE63_28015 [Caballeronia sp. LZ065]|uniref:hypothetical protein n=1 Tax=Caballeronia sp. LZ065 TaxID=3038571 RepID=UPI002859CFCE|nr:hypothetical protein [Caballeronia sp. LZ065]MDR5783260.1 hypothetical protein [Caballeronia sp. LZ065]